MHVQLRATTVLRFRSLAAGIVGLLTLSLVGCSPQTAPALSDFASHVCANLLRVATAAADPTRTGDRTQYGNAPNLLQADSLYETSWGVRLSALRHRYPHTLNKRATEKWLLDELALAVSRQGEFASAPVGGIRDSIEALVALGGVGKVHGNPFAAFQSKWGYSNVPDGEPDVSTTAMATQGLSALKLRPPTGVVAQFTAAVAAAPNATLSDVVNTEIPALQILSRVESGAAVRRAVPGLEPELNRWNSALLRNGAGGVQLSALWAIRDVALHAGIQVAPVPRKWAVELAAPGGFLALSPGGQGDPQVTYLGVKLGILPASAAMPVLDSGVSRSGWLIASKPTLDSLYDISALHALCNSPLHGDGAQLGRWTTRVLAEDAPTSRMLYEICSLHAIYHEELSAAAARSLARHATDALRTARTRAVTSVGELAQEYVAALACHATPESRTLTAGKFAGDPTSTAIDAYGAYLLRPTSSRTTAADGISRFLASTKVGRGYSYRPSFDRADVYSTGMALDIRGAREEARIAALGEFRSQGSWASETPSRSNPQPGATLGSLLAVAFLATGRSSDSLSPLFIN